MRVEFFGTEPPAFNPYPAFNKAIEMAHPSKVEHLEKLKNEALEAIVSKLIATYDFCLESDRSWMLADFKKNAKVWILANLGPAESSKIGLFIQIPLPDPGWFFLAQTDIPLVYLGETVGVA